MPTKKSRIFHDKDFLNNGARKPAPYTREKNQTNDAAIAPKVKYIRKSSDT